MKIQYEAPTIETVEVKQELSFCSPTGNTNSSTSMNVTYGEENW
jgi:hypothetical protein